MKIDHVNIAAPWDLLLLVKDFYCNALELAKGPRPDFGVRGFWLYGGGKPIMHLIESDNHYAADKPHFIDHIAYEMEGLEDYTKRLEKLSVEFSVKHIPDFNISQVFCKDPCGNGVEANFSNQQS
jgi:catechol-2,3-dioxygenase